MSRWFRFYADAIRNPKVAALSDADYRLWTELLSVAADNDGLIPPLEALKSLLRRRSDHLYAAVERLVKGGLIDHSGEGFEPHNWRKFQYKSDTSTDRVKRFRNGGRNVSETPPDTETDTETENPLNPPSGGKPDYAFFGRVIRLVPRDLAAWRKTYHAIPDLEAELASIDAWLSAPTTAEAKRKNWFHTVAGSLNRRHQEVLRERKATPAEDYRRVGI